MEDIKQVLDKLREELTNAGKRLPPTTKHRKRARLQRLAHRSGRSAAPDGLKRKKVWQHVAISDTLLTPKPPADFFWVNPWNVG